MIESVAVARRSADRTAAYDQHRRYVLAVLSRRCGWLAEDEREALLHDAWTVMLTKARSGTLDVEAMAPRQVRAYITQTAINCALDESRRARRRDRPLTADDQIEAPAVALHELVDADVEAERVREILGELTPRQQTILKLRFFLDRSPGETQQLLGVTERAYRRDLERALAVVAERFALVREGRFCDSRASVIRAYVAGIAGPNRARKAREHLATCPACRHYALELRTATGKAAALAPVPVLTVGHERFSGIIDAFLAAKQHAASLAARVDPASPVTAAGARPGALAATLGACLAIGGGTTYCVIDGLPGNKGRDAHGANERVVARPSRAPLRTRRTTIPATVTSSPKQTHRRAAPRARARTIDDGGAAEAADHEFGIEKQRRSPPPAEVAPAPKPSAAAREFGP